MREKLLQVDHPRPKIIMARMVTCDLFAVAYYLIPTRHIKNSRHDERWYCL